MKGPEKPELEDFREQRNNPRPPAASQHSICLKACIFSAKPLGMRLTALRLCSN
ncbi:hypothetical protein QF008_002005 [Pseudomonas protegens]|jgi:hypothetical protein|nr:hypothetical protein [Pseudomonas protegens]BCQ69696.1 hypothetical protein PEQA60_36860 [Pseudomonas sp. Eqa60]VAV69835.1 hypothetical protein PPRCHA0_3533 [Pseudomonas protegens CHA0]